MAAVTTRKVSAIGLFNLGAFKVRLLAGVLLKRHEVFSTLSDPLFLDRDISHHRT